MVNIALDLTSLQPIATGTDIYLKNLVMHLAIVDHSNNYRIYINCEDYTLFRELSFPKNFTIIPRSKRTRIFRLLFQQLWLPMANLFWADIIHSPAFIMPIIRGQQKHLLTIHDMTTFSLPECHTQLRTSKLYKKLVTRSIICSDVIQVPSKATQQEILRLIPGVSADKIHIIPCGVTTDFQPHTSEKIEKVLQHYQISNAYILSVGTMEPRKNLSRLLISYEKLIEQYKTSVDLVLVGTKGWKYSQLLQQLQNNKLKERIHVLGYTPQQDLSILYSGAKLLIYPSIQEGFGLPPLEAMACGTPVITSNNSSLAEYYGQVATLVNPLCTQDIANAIHKVLSNTKVQQQYRQKGLSLARKYRWENTAQLLVECYTNLGTK